MRQSEAEYWDETFKPWLDEGQIKDNLWKRSQIISRLLKYTLPKRKILEIGVGFGTTIFALDAVLLATYYYAGTEVSKMMADNVAKTTGRAIYHTDIKNLPGSEGEFDFVLMFDTLEHVRPEDRAAGFKEIDRVLAPDGIVLINNPLCESLHNDEFDYPLTADEIDNLGSDVGLGLGDYGIYKVRPHDGENEYSYEWIELRRQR